MIFERFSIYTLPLNKVDDNKENINFALMNALEYFFKIKYLNYINNIGIYILQ